MLFRSNTTAVPGGVTFGTVATGSANFVPLGSGYGPPEVAADKIRFSHTYYTGTVPSAALTENPWMFSLIGGNTSVQFGLRTFGSRFTTGATTPRLPGFPGRYGEVIPTGTSALQVWSISGTSLASGTNYGKPGVSNTNDLASQINDRLATGTAGPSNGIPSNWWSGTSQATFAADRAIYNSPPDQIGRAHV